MRLFLVSTAAALSAVASSPVTADVVAASESGFVSRNVADVATSPAETWAAMIRPGQWWNGDHTYSGNAANMTLDPAAGGCFCEVIPGADGGPAGEVEHMRVLYVAPGSMLRLSGGLGPLQGEAATGVLTITLEPVAGGTRIRWEYVVGGYLRMPAPELAPLVDRVMGEQLFRLAASLAEG